MGEIVITNNCQHERLSMMCTVGRVSCMDCGHTRDMTDEEAEQWPASLDEMPFPAKSKDHPNG